MDVDTEVSVRRVVRGVMVGLGVLALLGVAKCRAEERFVVGATAAAIHSNENYPYKTWVPGLYVRENQPTFKTVGAFRNSQGFWSVFGGIGHVWQGEVLDFTLVGGAVYGYRSWDRWNYSNGDTVITYGPARVQLFALPSVGVKLADNLTVRTFVMPPVGPVQAWSASFALEGKF